MGAFSDLSESFLQTHMEQTTDALFEHLVEIIFPDRAIFVDKYQDKLIKIVEDVMTGGEISYINLFIKFFTLFWGVATDALLEDDITTIVKQIGNISAAHVINLTLAWARLADPIYLNSPCQYVSNYEYYEITSSALNKIEVYTSKFESANNLLCRTDGKASGKSASYINKLHYINEHVSCSIHWGGLALEIMLKYSCLYCQIAMIIISLFYICYIFIWL